MDPDITQRCKLKNQRSSSCRQGTVVNYLDTKALEDFADVLVAQAGAAVREALDGQA